MRKGISPLVIGNWKMNPQTRNAAVRLAKELKTPLAKIRDIDVVIAPPTLFLESVHKIRNDSKVFHMGVQNVHHEKLGPHTGEVSIPMIKDFDVSHVILGHSERRADGETDVQINTKLLAVLKAGLTPVLCVGERKRDEGGHYLTFIEQQIRKGLAQVTRTKLSSVVIAYEPIWAIGTGENATPGDVHQMKLFIEKTISDMYGRNFAKKVRILYGGSVNEKNATELYTEGAIDGFLVGGASLHADAFVSIVKQVRNQQQ